MAVVYGADYSARELTPSELDKFTEYDIRFLIRYIGWPDNPKCISHYPGAYQAHVRAGRTVLLAAELGTRDPATGFAGGAAMAARPRRRGLDRLPGQPADLLLRRRLAGGPASRSPPRWRTWTAPPRWSAGPAPARTASGTSSSPPWPAAMPGGCGWPGRRPPTPKSPRAGRTSTSGTTAASAPAACRPTSTGPTPGVLDALSTPAAGQAPPWPLPPGQYFGLITGPAARMAASFPPTRPGSGRSSRPLIRRGYVPGVTDPAAPWADGTYTPATQAAVLRFQQAASLPQTGTVTAADWASLLA